MPITTKKGDDGSTSILYGKKVRKDNLRIEANGILDELNSSLGLSKSLSKKRKIKGLISRIQENLSTVASEIAANPASACKLKKRIGQKDIKTLESLMKKLENKCKGKKGTFVLPGENSASAVLDICRSIARTAERRIATLENKKMIKNHHILVYLNRLSDLLYILARIS